MPFAEIAGPGVIDTINDLYLEVAFAADCDQHIGADSKRSNAPRVVSTEVGDTITPPISLPNHYDSLTVTPWKVSINTDEENDVIAVSAEGSFHPPSTKRPEECQRWLYNLSIGEKTACYVVTKKALNGQEYVFNTQKPDLVSRASEILVGKTAQRIAVYNGCSLGN
jgi:hypothetical protein